MATSSDICAEAPARPRILVVDDDRWTREALGQVLTEEGYDVCLAQSRAEAVQALRKRVDLLLTGLELPRQGCREVVNLARRRRPSSPVVLLTQDTPQNALSEALRMGAHGFLNKPLDLDETLRHVNVCLACDESRTAWGGP